MPWRVAISGLIVALACSSARMSAQHSRGAARPAATTCGNAIGFQVLLDRHGFSPGEIDGAFGENAWRALMAFKAANDLPVTRALDCATWKALGGTAETTVRYTITDDDAAGPFAEMIPTDLVKQ